MIKITPFSFNKPFTHTYTKLDGEKSLATGYCFLLHDQSLLLLKKKEQLRIPFNTPNDFNLPVGNNIHLIGEYNSHPCYLIQLNEISGDFQTFTPTKLRELFSILPQDFFTLAGRALQISHWQNEHRFCGKCGTHTSDNLSEMSKSCNKCDSQYFPRLSPAVIMTVEHNNKILLGRSPHFTKGMYSTLAGFVEPGETLEEAVVREVKEESNLDVEPLNYVCSQPWPFPHSLMIGFRSKYIGGNLIINRGELEDARWFNIEELPPLPSTNSIASHLIELFKRETIEKG